MNINYNKAFSFQETLKNEDLKFLKCYNIQKFIR